MWEAAPAGDLLLRAEGDAAMRIVQRPRLLPGVLPALLIWLPAIGPSAAEPALLLNGGFETTQPVKLGTDGTFSKWSFADPPTLPRQWTVNTSYPGRLAVRSGSARSGNNVMRIEANADRTAHVYQMIDGFVADDWYGVEAWFRGGRLVIYVYEYFEDGRIRGRVLTQGVARTDDWQRLHAFYQPSGDGYLRSAVALATPAGEAVDVDDVSLTRLAVPRVDPDAPPAVFENEVLRLGIGRDARLAQFTCKSTAREYGVPDVPLAVVSATRNGMELTAAVAVPEEGLLTFRFPDPDTSVRVRVTPRRHHFLFEIVDVSPDDVDRVDIDFPVARLDTVSWAFNGTYDDEFGACLFGTTVNVCNRPGDHGGSIRSLRASCYREHGMVGAKFALVGAPRPCAGTHGGVQPHDVRVSARILDGRQLSLPLGCFRDYHIIRVGPPPHLSRKVWQRDYGDIQDLWPAGRGRRQ